VALVVCVWPSVAECRQLLKLPRRLHVQWVRQLAVPLSGISSFSGTAILSEMKPLSLGLLTLVTSLGLLLDIKRINELLTPKLLDISVL